MACHYTARDDATSPTSPTSPSDDWAHMSSVVAGPAASPPPVMSDSPGRIHHLLGSLGASQLLPRRLPADGSREALG
ncbi:hypothetical protein EYF80_031973 [Liparis tanakae]|uniref:Uncharacterized protein n=1 Tax=Liparis tanakae TaxID=230148 RepID=A0A4Z2GWF8_9TELE|nr:hypothetical protein EYF80_031973 [Liparis tanakae]